MAATKPYCYLGACFVAFCDEVLPDVVALDVEDPLSEECAACERTAPTEKPTRLRAGIVICLPPRIDLTLRAATLRRFQVPKPIRRTSCPCARSSLTTSVKASITLLVSLRFNPALAAT